MCGRLLKDKITLSKKTADDAKAISSLSDKEVSKVEIKNNTLAQTVRNKSTNALTTKKTYIPQESKVTITTKDDVTTKVDIKNSGFCFAPELALLRDYDHSYLGVGAKFFYWSRFSASAGCGVYDFNKLVFKPYVSVDYTIPYLKNTKVALNYNFSNIGVKLSISL